jgi:hypothetical protein
MFAERRASSAPEEILGNVRCQLGKVYNFDPFTQWQWPCNPKTSLENEVIL